MVTVGNSFCLHLFIHKICGKDVDKSDFIEENPAYLSTFLRSAYFWINKNHM